MVWSSGWTPTDDRKRGASQQLCVVSPYVDRVLSGERKDPTMADPTQCPVCGAPVDPQSAPSASYDDQTYYFDSQRCHDQFVEDPASFVGNTGS